VLIKKWPRRGSNVVADQDNSVVRIRQFLLARGSELSTLIKKPQCSKDV
jgi:hypothetical protein